MQISYHKHKNSLYHNAIETRLNVNNALQEDWCAYQKIKHMPGTQKTGPNVSYVLKRDGVNTMRIQYITMQQTLKWQWIAVLSSMMQWGWWVCGTGKWEGYRCGCRHQLQPCNGSSLDGRNSGDRGDRVAWAPGIGSADGWVAGDGQHAGTAWVVRRGCGCWTHGQVDGCGYRHGQATRVDGTCCRHRGGLGAHAGVGHGEEAGAGAGGGHCEEDSRWQMGTCCGHCYGQAHVAAQREAVQVRRTGTARRMADGHVLQAC